MKKISWLFISLFIIFSSCESNAKTDAAKADSYKETKEQLLKKEQDDPQRFLLVDGRDKKNLIGQTVIKGVITNKATIAAFKDIDVKLSFFSKTNVLLETDKETVFEVVQPGESKNFKTKYFAPKGTDSVALEITGAKVNP